MRHEEIAKHGKRLANLFAFGEPDFRRKLRDGLVEILIIACAVSISSWFQSFGEHRHEQTQARAFLLGLKRDVRADINQIYLLVNQRHEQDAQIALLAQAQPDPDPGFDYAPLERALNSLEQRHLFIPQTSRYEGFKSSGKLTTIENTVLLERITRLYQTDLPQLRQLEEDGKTSQSRLLDYLENGADDSKREARLKLINSPKGQRLLLHTASGPALYARYQSMIELGQAIIKDIDQLYPDNEPAVLLVHETARAN